MAIHSTHKSESGFTLIELLIVITIIGILAAIAIPQFNQYKIRGYDAHSKQALKDMHLLCNAYWLDTDALQGCDLPKIKEVTYGFNQNADVVATLPPSPLNNFCASAKHNSSPNTYSIDSASLISSGSGCSGAGGSVQTASVSPAQTFEGYDPCKEMGAPGVDTSRGSQPGVWMWVDSGGAMDGRMEPWVSNCNNEERDLALPAARGAKGLKRVLISPLPSGGEATQARCNCSPTAPPRAGCIRSQQKRSGACASPEAGGVPHAQYCAAYGLCRYDFETQTFIDEHGNRWDTSEYNKLAD